MEGTYLWKIIGHKNNDRAGIIQSTAASTARHLRVLSRQEISKLHTVVFS